MNTITRNALVARHPNLLSTDMDGETVMMSIEQGQYFGLNPVGSRTWELLGNPVRVDALCRQIETEYVVSSDECETAVLAFLSELSRHGLITAA
ncbi:MAG: lasso peptide biosynthesis PqqD family chaperone [Pseudomonadota bacterium]